MKINSPNLLPVSILPDKKNFSYNEVDITKMEYVEVIGQI
jgi:hypothetical protein